MRNVSTLLVPLLLLATSFPTHPEANGLDLEYIVTIANPASHRVQIRMVCESVPEAGLVLETSEFRGRFIV